MALEHKHLHHISTAKCACSTLPVALWASLDKSILHNNNKVHELLEILYSIYLKPAILERFILHVHFLSKRVSNSENLGDEIKLALGWFLTLLFHFPQIWQVTYCLGPFFLPLPFCITKVFVKLKKKIRNSMLLNVSIVRLIWK